MIGEIDPRGYDCDGTVTLLPDKKSLQFRPTAPMGTFLTGELSVHCQSLEDVRGFLRTCRYVSDPEQFGVRDHWSHPRDFETNRQGDCDCFAVWTWRQLLEMGHDARYVVGRVGYGRWFHAWVTYQHAGRHYLVEATAARRRKLSRLVTLLYEPIASVSRENDRLVYHQHHPRDFQPSLLESLAIVAEWAPLFMVRGVAGILLAPWYAVRSRLARRAAPTGASHGPTGPAPPPSPEPT